ncbi:MAG: ATP-dependent DNA helicase [Betaproteobacteria bacterium]|nr:ATP-dependent DNA helicase [Betaproteobacteria bacterium]
MQKLATIFAADGPLARHIPQFRQRDSQRDMARQVEQAIAQAGVLIAEAGTGTGKTFAYLVPALLSGGKTIISTGTKTLQDQLYHRDLPTVREALQVPVTTALLKGRANYVCLHHLDRALDEGRFPSREESRHIHVIRRFADRALNGFGSGDKAELSDVPERSNAWNQATSTRENCLGAQCTRHAECFLMKARKAAMDAEVVVVNHHLFFADLVLKDDGAQDLLPASNTVIFDEAHQLPETATMFFGQSVSSAQFLDLARDSRLAGVAHAPDFPGIAEATAGLDKAARDLRLAFLAQTARLSGDAIRATDGFASAVGECHGALSELRAALESQMDRHAEIAQCLARADELSARLSAWDAQPLDAGVSQQEAVIRWGEVFPQSVALHVSPLSVAEPFRATVFAQKRAWIFTSATLAVKGDFSHYQNELGLTAVADEFDPEPGAQKPVVTAQWLSPFDFPNRAVLYVPESLPLPNTPEHTTAVVDAALPLIAAAGGRTFLLFTSLRAMNDAHAQLKAHWERAGWNFPLMVQGEGTRTELLERFRMLGNAVLVASHSFWEGVDVKGQALSVVVIDKLPFAPPDDPILAARLSAIEKSGGNPFMEYQVPHTAIVLKQGAGRLIRDETDAGVLMIGDRRLIEKSYGRRIWQSLPPMRRTRDRAEAVQFLVQTVAFREEAATHTAAA